MDKPERVELAPWRAAAIGGPLKHAVGRCDGDAAQLPEEFRRLLDRLGGGAEAR